MDDLEILTGEIILNTRPIHQQEELSLRLSSRGASVVSLASIEIAEAETSEFLNNLETHLPRYDILLFVSRNAVSGFLGFLGDLKLSTTQIIGVIGEGTYRSVKSAAALCHQPIIEAFPYNSEGLLAAEALQSVNNKKILIIRGQQGRNLLGDELRRRGGRVDYCEVYQRRAPSDTAEKLAQVCSDKFPTIAVFTSNEGLQNIFKAVDADQRNQLLQIPWLLISERMRESSINLGHNNSIIIADIASDAGIELALCDWQNRKQSRP
jgi:uroporphyrinogen-III synthase